MASRKGIWASTFAIILTLLAFCAWQATAGSVPARPRNVLLITVDCLRADRILDERYHDVAPTMHELAEQGLSCTQARSQSDITCMATRCMFSSRWVHRELAWLRGQVAPPMASILNRGGWLTAGFFSIGEYCIAGRATRLSEGFDVFSGPCDSTNSVLARSGGDTTAEAAAWIRSVPTDRPWFAWVMTWDLHAQRTAKPVPYDDALAYSDECVASLMRALHDSGDDQNTLVILTGIHGYNDRPLPPAELRDLSDTMLRVPLVFWAPRWISPQHVTAQTGHVDVLPTTLALLGLTAPVELDGVDLTAPIAADRPMYAESEGLEARTIVRGNRKLVEYLDNFDLPRSVFNQDVLPADPDRPGWVVAHPGGTDRMFDVNGQDYEPREAIDDAARSALHADLERWQGNSRKTMVSPHYTPLQRAALKKHGYWPPD